MLKNSKVKQMAIRPRLVIDLRDNELNFALKQLAANHRTTIRQIVLNALDKTYHRELNQFIADEMAPSPSPSAPADETTGQ